MRRAACYALHQYRELLQLLGSESAALMERVVQKRTELADALQAVFDVQKGWYKRVWLGPGDGLGWRGDATGTSCFREEKPGTNQARIFVFQHAQSRSFPFLNSTCCSSCSSCSCFFLALLFLSVVFLVFSFSFSLFFFFSFCFFFLSFLFFSFLAVLVILLFCSCLLVDGVLWLEPNAWAVLSGVATGQNTTARVRDNIEQLLRSRSPVGSLFTSHGYPPSAEAYQGIWYCGNWVLVWSLGAPLVPQDVDADRAFEEWRKNAMATRSATYPDIFAGTVSGPDCYESVIFGTPGQPLTNAAFPKGVTFNAWFVAQQKKKKEREKERERERGGGDKKKRRREKKNRQKKEERERGGRETTEFACLGV